MTTVDAGDDGIQAVTDVLVTYGALDITSDDDAIHSDSTVNVDGGEVTLAAGDDAIHGDLFVTIDGGTIDITDSYEGIESEVITINDGVIDITSNDDGLNVASADATAETTTATQPGPGAGGPGGPGGDEAVGDHYIYINGGTISITVTGELDEQGDGIDANGHVVMTGGTVAVSGPTDTRNSALDYSGGSFEVTGGTLVGTNINGRNSEGVEAGSDQASLYLTFDTVIPAGTVVAIQSPSGDSLTTFEPVNQYDVVVFTSPDLAAGESYEVYLDGALAGTATAS